MSDDISDQPTSTQFLLKQNLELREQRAALTERVDSQQKLISEFVVALRDYRNEHHAEHPSQEGLAVCTYHWCNRATQLIARSARQEDSLPAHGAGNVDSGIGAGTPHGTPMRERPAPLSSEQVDSQGSEVIKSGSASSGQYSQRLRETAESVLNEAGGVDGHARANDAVERYQWLDKLTGKSR